MILKILNISTYFSFNNFDNFSKKSFSVKKRLDTRVQKVKNVATLLFESAIFQAAILSAFTFSFFISFLSVGSCSMFIAACVSGIALLILIKKKSDLLYELSTLDAIIRQKILKKRWPWFNQINENIFLGALPLKNLNHDKIFKDKNITAILSIIEKKETIKKTVFTTPIHLSYWGKNNYSHLHIPIKDRYPISNSDLIKAALFIHNQISNNKKIYVHCAAGRSRSATAIIAYLLKYKNMNLKQAFDFLKSKRRVVLVNSSQRNALKIFEQSL